VKNAQSERFFGEIFYYPSLTKEPVTLIYKVYFICNILYLFCSEKALKNHTHLWGNPEKGMKTHPYTDLYFPFTQIKGIMQQPFILTM